MCRSVVHNTLAEVDNAGCSIVIVIFFVFVSLSVFTAEKDNSYLYTCRTRAFIGYLAYVISKDIAFSGPYVVSGLQKRSTKTCL